MSLPMHHRDDDLTINQAIFFRVSDRLRLEGYVAGLIQSGMSLSMVSTQDAILDHYGKLLVARLREAAPEIEEGRGRAVVWGWVLPEIGVIYKMIAHIKPGP